MSTSEIHSLKNTGLTLEEALRQTLGMIKLASCRGLRVRVGLQNVFGCFYEGRIPIDRILSFGREVMEADCSHISLADSTGLANPNNVRKLLFRVKNNLGVIPALHLHDTRGMAMANFIEAVHQGVTEFDASLGGTGGCPFIPDAAGNIALEDLVYAAESMGWQTGVDLKKVCALSHQLAALLGKSLPGKLYKLNRGPTQNVTRSNKKGAESNATANH